MVGLEALDKTYSTMFEPWFDSTLLTSPETQVSVPICVKPPLLISLLCLLLS